MRRLALPLLALSSGCLAADELTGGVAVWPFVLSSDTTFAEIAHVRGGVVGVGVLEVEDWRTLRAEPVGDAGVSGLVGDQVAILAAEGSGLYRSGEADLQRHPPGAARPDRRARAGSSPTRPAPRAVHAGGRRPRRPRGDHRRSARR